jgi:hypothetical protein
MPQPISRAPRALSWRGAAVFIVLSAAALCIGFLAVWVLASSRKTQLPFALKYFPAFQRPVTIPAAEATLQDDAEVVGVQAGGRSRAYVLEALYAPERHVINDVVGGKPISITYCDMTDHLAVFTDPNGDGPLEIAPGGWQGRSVAGRYEGGMLLRIGSSWYRQDTEQPLANHVESPFPYPKAEFVRTTWKEWRESHPNADVYVGESPAGSAPNQADGLATSP